MTTPTAAPLNVVVHQNQLEDNPAHHVTRAPIEPRSGLLSYFTTSKSSTSQSQSGKLSSRSSSQTRDSAEGGNDNVQTQTSSERIAFRNPWPSAVKPTKKQIWDALEWGEDLDPSIDLAISHLTDANGSVGGVSTKSNTQTISRTQAAARLLRVEEPNFDFDPEISQAKTTWLGHAGILVQLPPLKPGRRPIRCIFDPIFSNRCSPSQVAGPVRSYRPPCKLEDLPPIDIYIVSHDHYDHLDYETVVGLWKLNGEHIRFVVPLGNKQYFVNAGVTHERVTELDWWESVELSQIGTPAIKLTCTPAQHRSGGGLVTDQTLWASWYMEHPRPKPYRIYFAGDTGYQFHASPKWPPKPSIVDGKLVVRQEEHRGENHYPSCPAFQEISEKLGSPDLLLLPVAVGASYSYMRSCVPLPDSVSPVPRHHPGVTGANHMPPWDAVRVLRLMTGESGRKHERQPLAIAMHWGTFVPERTEVLKTLGQLEFACFQQDVTFARSLDNINDTANRPIFVALNHGQSIVT